LGLADKGEKDEKKFMIALALLLVAGLFPVSTRKMEMETRHKALLPTIKRLPVTI
jgi:hypothetical protein